MPLMRRLWTAEEISHVGEFYSMADVRIHPAPIQPGGPPLIVAGRQKVAMRRAVRLGDGWMPYLYSARRYAASVATIRELAHEEGRDLAGFEWLGFLFTNVGRTHEEAVEQASGFLGGNYRQDFSAILPNVAVVGTADEVTEQMQAYVDAGARHLVVVTAGHPQPQEMQHRIVEDIFPRLIVREA
jgi:alkanesulfonate monooxygenase SsuD/methylene tetrahydromethanopterin reductase-like flavin-dependent oxidoreductase (luciferase family)